MTEHLLTQGSGPSNAHAISDMCPRHVEASKLQESKKTAHVVGLHFENMLAIRDLGYLYRLPYFLTIAKQAVTAPRIAIVIASSCSLDMD